MTANSFFVGIHDARCTIGLRADSMVSNHGNHENNHENHVILKIDKPLILKLILESRGFGIDSGRT